MIDFLPKYVHMWPMLRTVPELLRDLGGQIRRRRLTLGWSQEEASRRSGVAYRTWRRLESEGAASIEDLVKAAVALRCEDGLAGLFPEPAAVSMDQLLQRQAEHRPPSPMFGHKRPGRDRSP